MKNRNHPLTLLGAALYGLIAGGVGAPIADIQGDLRQMGLGYQRKGGRGRGGGRRYIDRITNEMLGRGWVGTWRR